MNTAPTPTPTPLLRADVAGADSATSRPVDGWHASTTTLTRDLTLPGAATRTLRLDIETWNREQTLFSLYLDGAALAHFAIPRDARGDDAAEYRAEGLQWVTSVIRDSILAPVVEITGQAQRELQALTIARTPATTEIALAVPAKGTSKSRKVKKASKTSTTKGRR